MASPMRAPDRKRRAQKAANETLAEVTICKPPKNAKTRRALASMTKLAVARVVDENAIGGTI